jgi:hypothetical protein
MRPPSSATALLHRPSTSYPVALQGTTRRLSPRRRNDHRSRRQRKDHRPPRRYRSSPPHRLLSRPPRRSPRRLSRRSPRRLSRRSPRRFDRLAYLRCQHYGQRPRGQRTHRLPRRNCLRRLLPPRAPVPLEDSPRRVSTKTTSRATCPTPQSWDSASSVPAPGALSARSQGTLAGQCSPAPTRPTTRRL